MPLFTRKPLPEGRAGVRQTVSTMRALIRSASTNPATRSLAVSVIQNIDGELPRVRALFEYVQTRMRYVRDPVSAEVVGSAKHHLGQVFVGGCTAGDCDDHVVFLGSLLESVGFPTRIVTARTSNAPGVNDDHTYLEAAVRGVGWLPLDASVKTKGAGWRAPDSRRTNWIDTNKRRN